MHNQFSFLKKLYIIVDKQYDYLLILDLHRGALGCTIPHDHLQAAQAFGVEFLITFVLLFTVFASIDSSRTDLGGSVPLTIGLAVGVCHLFAVS